MPFVVIHTDDEPSTSVHGPFKTRKKAQAWVAAQAEDVTQDRSLIDAWNDGNTVEAGDYRWEVKPLEKA